jgi:enoyl-[acyl-carrier-protein] reductase (NADH)
VLDLQDKVTRETARLAASVYNNGEILEKLTDAAEELQSVERDQAVEETSATLWRASHHMRRLVFDMMKTLEHVNEIVDSVAAAPKDDTTPSRYDFYICLVVVDCCVLLFHLCQSQATSRE